MRVGGEVTSDVRFHTKETKTLAHRYAAAEMYHMCWGHPSFVDCTRGSSNYAYIVVARWPKTIATGPSWCILLAVLAGQVPPRHSQEVAGPVLAGQVPPRHSQEVHYHSQEEAVQCHFVVRCMPAAHDEAGRAASAQALTLHSP
jgi:hypothetical protein